MKKTALITRVYNISEALNIPQGLVDSVVREYYSFLREELVQGRRISLSSIVYIVPENEVKEYRVTLAYICKVISTRCSCTYNTVNEIISKLYETIWEDLLNGTSVTFHGLCNVHPLKYDGVVSRVQSSVSLSLTELMRENGGTVRVHTNQALKYRLIQRQAEGVS